MDPSKTKSSIPMAKQEEIIITNYMKECFDKVAVNEGFKDYTIKVNYGSNVGDGFVSNMLKVLIEERQSNKSLNVLVKIPVANKVRRETMKMTSLFKREIYVYNFALPEFINMQTENKLCDSLQFLNVPKIYFGEFNEEIDEAIIIMEDLRDSGYKMWNKSVPINLDHAILLMKILGRLHGLSFAMRTKKPLQFKAIQNLNDDFSDVLQSPQLSAHLKGSVVRVLDFFQQNEEDVKKKIVCLINNLNDIVIEDVKPKYVEPYAVMLHGDCWINNYLFQYNINGTPSNIKLIDWQISRYGSPAIDLIYFFFICTDQKLRVKHFDELINIYYDSLNQTLQSMGCDSNNLFPFKILRDHLKKFGKFGVVMSTFIMPALLAKEEQILDLDYVMENLDGVKEISDHVVENMIETDLFSKRIREIVFDAIDFGYM